MRFLDFFSGIGGFRLGMEQAGHECVGHIEINKYANKYGNYVIEREQKDTFEKAEKRLNDTIKAGFMPYAMLYRDDNEQTDLQWERFQREWLRPEIVATKMKAVTS